MTEGSRRHDVARIGGKKKGRIAAFEQLDTKFQPIEILSNLT